MLHSRRLGTGTLGVVSSLLKAVELDLEMESGGEMSILLLSLSQRSAELGPTTLNMHTENGF